MDVQKEIKFTLKSFTSPSRALENRYVTQDCDAHCLLTPPSYYEDDSCALGSVPSSPSNTDHMRSREMDQPSPTSMYFRPLVCSSPRRRSSALRIASSPVEELKRNMSLRRSSMLHSGISPTSFEQDSIDKTAPRRASTMACIPMQRAATRKPSLTMPEKSIKMRRESVLEKLEIEENLSRSSSPSMKFNPIIVPRRKVESPCIKAQSLWTSDDMGYQISPELLRGQEMEDDEDDEIELVTARRVSLAEYQTLPFYLKTSKFPAEDTPTRRSSMAWPGTWSDAGSNTQKTTDNRSNDLVGVVTALQAAHLEETRRLNEVIASLSTKVATLESELHHMTDAAATAPAEDDASVGSSPSSTSSRYSSPLATPMDEMTSWRATLEQESAEAEDVVLHIIPDVTGDLSEERNSSLDAAPLPETDTGRHVS